MRPILVRVFLLAGLGAIDACGGGSATPQWRDVVDLDNGVLAGWRVPGSDETFFSGEAGTLIHFDGKSDFCRYSAPDGASKWWIWGSSPSDVYAGGEKGTLVHWDGTSWHPLDAGFAGEPIYGIWGASADDVWLVGGTVELSGPGHVARGNAKKGFTAVQPDLDKDGKPADAKYFHFKIWGSAANDVWIVGLAGDAYHYDGSGFTHATLPGPNLIAGQIPDKLVTVTGRARDDVYAVGGTGNGVVFRFNGQGWTFVGDPRDEPLSGAWTGPGEDLYVTGPAGLVKRRASDGTWSKESVPTTLDLHEAIGIGGGRVFAVGAKLFDIAPPRKGSILYRSVDPLPTATLHPCSGEVILDGGAPDAASPPDLAAPDLAASDLARPDSAIPDAAAPDVAMPNDLAMPDLGPGAWQPCGIGIPCAPTYECWEIGQFSGNFRCTKPCMMPADCGNEFGPNPQCVQPGCQVQFGRCLPQGEIGCEQNYDLAGLDLTRHD